MDEYGAINTVNAFGEELRAHRAHADLRIADLGAKLNLSAAMVGAIERGTRAARLNTAEQCDQIFGTPETFVRLWRLAARSAVPSQVSPYYDLEAQATRVHKWELRCVPGLLQTPDYASAIMRTGLPREADDILEEDLRLRIERQEILTRDEPPLAWFILDESVLYRPYGDMRKQLQHLTEMAELPNVVVQVLRHAMTDHPGLRGPITILEFADSPPVGYAEGWGSGRLIESTADVAVALACYDLIRASALSRDASLKLIKQTEGSK